MKEVVNVIIKL